MIHGRIDEGGGAASLALRTQTFLVAFWATESVVEWECLTVRTGEQLSSCYHISGLGGYDERFREVCVGASAAVSIATLYNTTNRDPGVFSVSEFC